MVWPLVDEYHVVYPSLGLGGNSQCRFDKGCESCTPAKAKVSGLNTARAEEIYTENKKNSALYKTVPQELLDRIFSHLTISSAISAKSSCKLFYRCGPPLCHLTTKAHNHSTVVYDLRCKGEQRGGRGEQLCCSYCTDLHDPIMFSKTHHAKSPYRRLCKGSIYHVELNPHWSMGFRPMSNLITNLQPYNSFVMPSGPPARFFTSGLYALPGYSQDDSNVMRRHGQPFLVFNPEETSEFYPNRNFSLPAVAIAPLPGQPTYAFFPLVVSSAWLRKGDDSILLVSKWTFRKDIKMQEQWDKSAILAEVRQHSFNICPHVKLNDKRVVHAVSEHHAPIPRRITVDCSQCATAINVSSSKEAIPELPTHTSYKIVLIVERNLGKFKTPTDPEWLAQLALETMDGKQTSMPLCLQACCRWTP